MTCDRAEDRTLLLSLGLFGIPSGRDESGREQGSDEPRRRQEEEGGRAR